MQISAPLDAWMSNPDAQRRTLERNVAADRGWRASPVSARFYEALDRCADTPEAVAAAVMRIVADDMWVRRLVAEMGEHLAADPFFTPPMKHIPGMIGDGLLLLSHRRAALSLVVVHADALAAKKLTPGERAISFSGQLTIRKILKSNGARIQRYEADPAGDDLRLSDAPPCRVGSQHALSDGELLVIDGRRESFTFVHARGEIAFLQCEVQVGPSPFRVEYCPDRLVAIAASSTDEAASRSQMMLSCLRSLGKPVALDIFDDQLGSRHFQVRWHAMRELMAADATAGLDRLRIMARSDSHPDIRAAATRAIESRPAGGASCRV